MTFMFRGVMCIAQAGDRAHRIGQKKAVLVLVLVAAGTIEEAILDRAQQKRDIDAKVIQVCLHPSTRSALPSLHASLASPQVPASTGKSTGMSTSGHSCWPWAA